MRVTSIAWVCITTKLDMWNVDETNRWLYEVPSCRKSFGLKLTTPCLRQLYSSYVEITSSYETVVSSLESPRLHYRTEQPQHINVYISNVRKCTSVFIYRRVIPNLLSGNNQREGERMNRLVTCIKCSWLLGGTLSKTSLKYIIARRHPNFSTIPSNINNTDALK